MIELIFTLYAVGMIVALIVGEISAWIDPDPKLNQLQRQIEWIMQRCAKR